ncbi:hypothetical protein [Pseudozobellia thermophila]|uniref:hypothetical protein n=1 Tax=Pseudozobellia thermophila TaxID=192903 RepID=UPI001114A163|nr:hypothetical protein [Pseudozobellia thermophila]
MAKAAVLSFLMVAFLSCKGQRKGTVGTQENGPDPEAAISLVVSDYHQVVGNERTWVIKNRKELQKFYSELNKTRKPALPVPKVDFGQNMLLVHFYQASDSGTPPRLSVLRKTGDTLFLAERGNGPSHRGGREKLVPFSIYLMPKSEGTIVVEPRID